MASLVVSLQTASTSTFTQLHCHAVHRDLHSHPSDSGGTRHQGSLPPVGKLAGGWLIWTWLHPKCQSMAGTRVAPPTQSSRKRWQKAEGWGWRVLPAPVWPADCPSWSPHPGTVGGPRGWWRSWEPPPPGKWQWRSGCGELRKTLARRAECRLPLWKKMSASHSFCTHTHTKKWQPSASRKSQKEHNTNTHITGCWWWWCRASCPQMSVDILGTNCDPCWSMVQCCFMSTEILRLIRMESPGQRPHLSRSSRTLT